MASGGDAGVTAHSSAPEQLAYWMRSVSALVIPLLVVAVLIYAAHRKVAVYEEFAKGAKDGVSVALRILPFLVGMYVAIGVLRSSGALDLAMSALSPLLTTLGVPTEVVPLALIRPLSGSGSLGVLADLLSVHGPDSLIGRMASTIQGSCDTTFYIVTVYFGAVGIRRFRHAITVGLLADLVGFAAAVAVCKLVFG
jgi:spore maturation protein B